MQYDMQLDYKGKIHYKKISHLQFVHHESHIEEPGTEPGPPPGPREMCVNRPSAPTSQRSHRICVTRNNPFFAFYRNIHYSF